MNVICIICACKKWNKLLQSLLYASSSLVCKRGSREEEEEEEGFLKELK